MLKSIAYHLKNLTNLEGRDGQRVFWHYFIFVVILNVVVSIIASIPMTIAAMQAGVDAIQSGDEAATEAAVLQQVIAYASTLVWVGIALAVSNMTLLAASCARRANDAGLPSILVFVPLALQAIWIVLAYRQSGSVEESLRSAATAQLEGNSSTVGAGMVSQDLLGWLVIGIVVILGCIKSKKDTGAN